jgi:membrane protein DedA with SNARE-associated domain
LDLGNVLNGVQGTAGDSSLPAVLAVFVQEAGVPLPLPIGALLLLLGYQAGSRPLAILTVTLLLVEVATVLGSSIKFWFGLKGGRPLLYSYGRFVRLGPARLERSERRFQEHDTRAVVVGRILPGVSMIVPLTAGAMGMPYRRFLPAVAIGSGINIVILVLVGFWAGPSLVTHLVQLGLSLRLLATVALLLALVGGVLLLRRQAAPGRQLPVALAQRTGPVERALIAGLLAMFEMGIGINLVLYAMAAFGLVEPERALLRFLDVTQRLAGSSPAGLTMLIAVFVAGGVLWALLYTLLAVRYLPGPPVVRGLLYSIVPFTASLGLLWALGFGFLGLGLGAGLIPVAGEVARCALFGAGLGTAEDMVRRAASGQKEVAAAPAGRAGASPAPSGSSGAS